MTALRVQRGHAEGGGSVQCPALRGGEGDLHAASAREQVGHLNGATMCCDDRVDDRQSKSDARSAAGVVCLAEPLECAREELRVESVAFILDGEPEPIRRPGGADGC